MIEYIKVVAFCFAFLAVGAVSANLPLGYLFLFPVTFVLGFLFARKTKLSRDKGAMLVMGVTTIGCILGALYRFWR